MNFEGPLHVDGNNIGRSIIKAVGKFTGGMLFLEDPSGDVERELILKTSSQGSSAPQRNPGIVRGNLVDVRTFKLFEGSTRLHKATCAEGERYSLVIFSICDKGDFAAHGRNARGTAGAFFLKAVDVAEKADPSGFILAREERTRLLVRTQRLSDLLRARRMIFIKMYRADLWIA